MNSVQQATAIGALASWAAKPSYTPLFSGLQASDASTIVDQLRTDGVPYQLTDGGGTILVPEANVYDERLKAASSGLPTSSNGGYNLLDKMGVTSSEFQQDVTYKRALEGELANTIGAIKGVKTASVQLAIPKATVFTDKKADPTASVFVATDNGVTLSSDQVQAIVHLTSAAIDGMKPTDVAVVDAQGTVLSAVGTGATGGTDKQANVYEEKVRGDVQAMLDRVVGAGNATVVVAATMKPDSGTKVTESFTSPDKAPALSESTKTQTSTGSGGGGAGVLGPDNIAVPSSGSTAGTTTTGGGTYKSEEATKNNAINKVTETTNIPAGSVNRQTISVALNTPAAAKLDVAGVKALVTSAAGVDAARGDAVTVEVLPFDTSAKDAAAAALSAADAAAAAARQAELIRTVIITAGVVLAIVLALVVYALRSRRQAREPVDIGVLDENLASVDALAPLPISTSTSALQITPIPVEEPEIQDIDRKRAQIDAMAAKDPQRTAEYLRSLMDDRQPV